MTCVEELTCFPEDIMDILSFWTHQFAIPEAGVLGIFLGILVAGIYLWTRSINILVILGIYAISVTSAFALEPEIQAGYDGIVWVIAIAVASLAVIMFMKVTRH